MNNVGIKESFIKQFNSIESELVGNHLPWLKKLRTDAINEFKVLEVPNRYHEDWKYTSVDAILNQEYTSPISLDSIDKIDVEKFKLKECYNLIFINGKFSSKDSNLSQYSVDIKTAVLNSEGLASEFLSIKSHENIFTCLNSAFLNDGAFISIPKDISVELPIHIINVITEKGISVNLRNIIHLEENSHAKIIESYYGVTPDSYFTNVMTDIQLGENSRLDYYKNQHEHINAFHISVTNVKQGKSSHFNGRSYSAGGRIVRSDIHVTFLDEHASCDLKGLFFARGEQHVDHHTSINHAVKNCTSHEYYKGIIDDRARGVFNGKIIVQKNAVKTNANLTNKNILLAKTAEIDTKPELEIYADDVKCAHGATVGQLDEDAIYYLCSRGLSEQLARGFLVQAFANDILKDFELKSVREALTTDITMQLDIDKSVAYHE